MRHDMSCTQVRLADARSTADAWVHGGSKSAIDDRNSTMAQRWPNCQIMIVPTLDSVVGRDGGYHNTADVGLTPPSQCRNLGV